MNRKNVLNFVVNCALDILVIICALLMTKGYRIPGGPGWTYLAFFGLNIAIGGYFVKKYADPAGVPLLAPLLTPPYFCMLYGIVELSMPGMVASHFRDFGILISKIPFYFALPK